MQLFRGVHNLTLLLAVMLLAAGCAQQPSDAETASTEQIEPDIPTTDPAVQAALDRWVVSEKTVGAVRFGMSLQEAIEAANEEIEVDEDVANSGCVYGRAESMPEGMALMVDEGIVARVDLRRGSLVLSSMGIGNGFTLQQAKAAYGDRGEIGENRYEEMQIEVWDLDASGGGYGSVFTAAEDTIYAWRSGLVEQVSYVEGCS